MPIYADKKDGKLTGRWRVEVQKGSQRLRGRYNNYEEAQVAESEFRTRLDSGEIVTEAKRRSEVPVTLGEGLRRAATSLWRGTKSADQSVQQLTRAFTLMGLTTRIDDISTTRLDSLVDKLYERKVSDATINRYLSSVHKFVKWASDRDYYTKKMPAFPWKEEDEGRIRWITPAEEMALMDLLPPDIAKLVKVAIRTGMRRGELLTLQKDQLQEGRVHLWKTKSGSPRTIPCTPEIFGDLQYLVANAKLPTAHQLRYAWDAAKEAMGLKEDPNFVFHACRHTCATRLVQANVNIRIIQRFMGHLRIETTMRYAHVSDEMLDEAVVRMESHSELGKVRKVDTSPTVLIAPLAPGGDPGKGPAGVAKLVDAPDLGSSAST